MGGSAAPGIPIYHRDIGVLVQVVHLQGQFLRQQEVISIQKVHIFSSCGSQPRISGCGRSLVLLIDVNTTNPTGFDGLAGVVGGAIVHDNDLVIRERLGCHAQQRLLDEAGVVVCGNDHADLWNLIVALFPHHR